MESEKLETHDIAVELEKLAGSGVFPQRTTDACAQAAWLLRRLREVVITAVNRSPAAKGEAFETLRLILVKHHEG